MKRILSTLLAVGALTAFSSTQAANSPLFHSPTTGNNYIAYDLYRTGAQAKAYCVSKGGQLAVVNTHAEADELMAELDLLLPDAVLPDSEAYYTIGSTIPANTTVPKNINTQAFFQDPAYYYLDFDGTATATERYLTVSPLSQYFKWVDLTTQTRRFVCEFNHAPI
ncbi:hypothetical protein JCM14076_15960 [Methylosoma difficile]